jgi:hypothetical protein
MLIGIGMSLMAGLKSSASPASLFANGEVGVWYDPSDVANLAWRYNLLTYTEQFDNAAWVNNGGTVSANALVAPDGTSTADYLVRSSAAGDGRYQVIAAGTSGVCTVSVYIKKDTSNNSLIWLYDATAVADRVFATIAWSGSTPVVTATVGTAATPQSVGNGWWRLSVTSTSLTGANTNRVYLLPAYTGSSNGQQTAFWGAQLELGSTATAYQMITDVVTQTIANCPNNTLFQDNAGTTPVTAPGQTVGLMLDKSKGLVLGSELVTNGTFSANVTGWTAQLGASIAWSSGELEITSSSTNNNGVFQGLTGLTVGRRYVSTATVRRGTCADIVRFGVNGIGDTTTNSTANVTLTYMFVATATSHNIQVVIGGTSSNGQTAYADNISVKLLAGNHATQATLAQRPTYGINPIVGTRNLLTYTEQFALWDTLRATVTDNSTTAPDGTSSADTLLNTAVAGTHVTIRTITKAASALTYTATVYLKKSTLDQGELRMSDQSGNGVRCTFNLTTVAVGTPVAFGAGFVTGSSQITDAGNGWYRVTLTGTTNAAVTLGIEIYIADASGNVSYTGTGAGFFIWGAQLEQSATATAYQKVVSQYEVTQAGVQSAGYLAFDGVDDGMVTNTITPAIDKVQVFAGVRKLSDAAEAVLLEMNTTYDTGNGAFALFAPGGISVARDSAFVWASKGTLKSFSGPLAAAFPAPITNVLAGVGDISSDVNILRVNGVQASQSTADQGTGNYLAYPLYIGRRGGASNPFNGRIYSLIVRFGANLTSGQITSTELYVGDKTGVNIANVISPTIFARDDTAVLDRFNATIERRA